jgi:hypothetical protein
MEGTNSFNNLIDNLLDTDNIMDAGDLNPLIGQQQELGSLNALASAGETMGNYQELGLNTMQQHPLNIGHGSMQAFGQSDRLFTQPVGADQNTS